MPPDKESMTQDRLRRLRQNIRSGWIIPILLVMGLFGWFASGGPDDPPAPATELPGSPVHFTLPPSAAALPARQPATATPTLHATSSPVRLTPRRKNTPATPTGVPAAILSDTVRLTRPASIAATARPTVRPVPPTPGRTPTVTPLATLPLPTPTPTPTLPCLSVSTAVFDIIPVDGPAYNHPDRASGDLNLYRRGFQPVAATPALVQYNGPTDADSPQLSGLFQPARVPSFQAAYQVNRWLWTPAACDGNPHGCAGPPLTDWEVSLVGVNTTPGELLTIPRRGAEIYAGGYRAMVLYADERQITLGYTRRDTVAAGYVVHLLGVCVDPNLLALYRAQVDADGWRAGNGLPALRLDQPFGRAAGNELLIAVRDNGAFMDPRSRKDWWKGY